MAAFGLTLKDVAAAPVEIWPDNWQAFKVFDAIGTQWRIGFNGATGLDYSVLPEIWRRTKTKIEDRDSVFLDLRIMEEAALQEMRKG